MLMRALRISKGASDARLLKDYSRNGLYELLKRHLVDPQQFDAVEAYAMLSARAAQLLGSRLRGMTDSGFVKTFAGLDSRSSKIAVELADAYAVSAPTDVEASENTPDVQSDRTLVAGRALVALLESGTTLLKNARAERNGALTVLSKMSGALGKDVWSVLPHAGHLENMSRVSAPLAVGFGALAAQMDPAVAKILDGINYDKVAIQFAQKLIDICGAETVAVWLVGPDYVHDWKSAVMDLNRDLGAANPGPELGGGDKNIIRGLYENMKRQCLRAPAPVEPCVESKPLPETESVVQGEPVLERDAPIRPAPIAPAGGTSKALWVPGG